MEYLKKLIKIIDSIILKFLIKIAPTRIKRIRELNFWKNIKIKEEILSYNHYLYFFTSHFNLDIQDYKDKKILDIGCGPRGSLEWADMSSERIGLDPLANSYLKLGASKHKMTYVNASAEKVPCENDYFDFVSSFNSLDHVDDLDKAIYEIKRVLKPGGLFLLITELNHDPTVTEPITFSWDIVKKFEPELEIIEEEHYERVNGIYESIREDLYYNHKNLTKRSGVLKVKFRKKYIIK